MASPPVDGAVPLSATGFNTAVTVTVFTTVAHVCGVSLSHNW
ncbi:hypothetical protein [Flavobacterium psychrophilum]|nr:hypothetical protein [Flavobacterium psychrophilum]